MAQSLPDEDFQGKFYVVVKDVLSSKKRTEQRQQPNEAELLYFFPDKTVRNRDKDFLLHRWGHV